MWSRLANDAVGPRLWLKRELERVLFEQHPPYHTDGRKQNVEDQAQYNAGIDPPERFADGHPQSVDWCENFREQHRWQQEPRRSADSPEPQRLGPNRERPQPNQQTNATDGESKRADEFCFRRVRHWVSLSLTQTLCANRRRR